MRGFSAYAPDVPGCIATGSTRDEVEQELKGAMAFHLAAGVTTRLWEVSDLVALLAESEKKRPD